MENNFDNKEKGRLDQVVASLTDLSRSQASKAIKNGEILVDGKEERRASFLLVGGEKISYFPKEKAWRHWP